MPVAEPHKELRFTRSAQAVPFWILAAVAGATAITIFTIGLHKPDNPALPAPGWSAVPALLCWAALRIAIHCTRRAYLILSPLGVEIFPFFRPVAGMRMIPWSEIHAVEVGRHLVTLHFNAEQEAGVHLDLAPIARARRPLLAKALEGRLENNRQSAVSDPQS